MRLAHTRKTLTGALVVATAVTALVGTGSSASAAPDQTYKNGFAKSFDANDDVVDAQGNPVDVAPRTDILKVAYQFVADGARLRVSVQTVTATTDAYESEKGVTQSVFADLFPKDVQTDLDGVPQANPLATLFGTPGDGSVVEVKLGNGDFVDCRDSFTERIGKEVRLNVPYSCLGGIEAFVGQASVLMSGSKQYYYDRSRTATKRLTMIRKN